MQIQRLRRRTRLLDGEDVLSEILDRPAATDTLFDVLAACLAAFAGSGRLAVLGFAGGGLVAPLRAMRCDAALRAVDRSLAGEKIFRELSAAWCGRVQVTRADAHAWLRRQKDGFDVILDDLSLPGTSAEIGRKPDMSLAELPHLVKKKLKDNGVAINNLLPVPGQSWDAVVARASQPFRQVHVVHLEDYVNRIVIAGRGLATARQVSDMLRHHLTHIGSLQSSRLRVRRWNS